MKKRLVFVTLICMAMVVLPAICDGLLWIGNPFMELGRHTEHARMNVKYHQVAVDINDQVAVTKVDQVFENPYNYEVEGTYIFPIPENADINNFTMHVGEKLLTAKVLDKTEAREVYEAIVRTHKDPALLEYIGRGMFQAKVYPIPANGNIRVTLEYSEVLQADNGTVKYYYTLNTEKFSANKLENVSVNVNIRSEKPVLNVYSPSHKIDVQTNNAVSTVVSYKEEYVRPDKDFILYYTLPQDEFGFNVLTYKENGEDGFFLAMVSPTNDIKTQTIINKNILFVLDISGSMFGPKIEQAKQALKFCLDHLNPGDRFNIITFNSNICMYMDALVEANQRNINQAINFVNNLSASCGTDIYKALKIALGQLPESNDPNMIIFLTDGQPTSGLTDITQIIANTKSANLFKTRLFSFGVGNDVNTTLLDKISLDNKGVADFITPQESIESKIVQFYTKVANPILTDISLNFSGTDVKDLYPITLPDLFQGSQLLVFGRYTTGGPVELDLVGKHGGVEKHYSFATNFVVNNMKNDFLPRIWAGRRIAYLTDQIILEGESKTLVDEIIKLGKKYGIVTRYTSFLIDSDAKQFSSATFLCNQSNNIYMKMMCDASVQTGASSIAMAKSRVSNRFSYIVENDAEDADVSVESLEKVKNVKARTFYLKGNVWIDSLHNSDAIVTKIKFLSPEYFDLLRSDLCLCEYLALGREVIISTGGDTSIIISADKITG